MSTIVYTASSPAKLLLVNDHPMLRQGMSNLLRLEDDVEVVGEASDGRQALSFLAANKVDLIVLDHNMSVLNSSETLKEIKDQDIEVKTLLFTVSDCGHDVQAALKLGVDGYLLKDMETELIIESIRKILRKELVISPNLASILAQTLRTPIAKDIAESLTTRE